MCFETLKTAPGHSICQKSVGDHWREGVIPDDMKINQRARRHILTYIVSVFYIIFTVTNKHNYNGS